MMVMVLKRDSLMASNRSLYFLVRKKPEGGFHYHLQAMFHIHIMAIKEISCAIPSNDDGVWLDFHGQRMYVSKFSSQDLATTIPFSVVI